MAIYGEIKKEERGGIVQQFQTDPGTMVFIGQIDTAGTGITLTAADTCVYYSVSVRLSMACLPSEELLPAVHHRFCQVLLFGKRRQHQVFRRWASANGPTTPQRFWNSTGRRFPAGGIFGH